MDNNESTKCGCTIWVRSEFGNGSDFRFSLPVNTEKVTATNNSYKQ